MGGPRPLGGPGSSIDKIVGIPEDGRRKRKRSRRKARNVRAKTFTAE